MEDFKTLDKCKRLAVTNTVAYNNSELMTIIKVFILHAPVH